MRYGKLCPTGETTMENQRAQSSRRNVLIASVAGAVGLMAAGLPAPAAAAEEEIKLRKDAADPWRGLKVGCATYTLNKLKTDDAIKAIARVGLPWCSIKDFHLPYKSTA